MNLSDHLRPLLRDHDCVIIPDFGGLVAEYTPAQMQPAGRHLLSPPTRQVAFNQALTRNDGLLLDALREHLGLSAVEAREQLHQAVAQLHRELQGQQRTELPGIGVFRQLAGRGLQFEYTGTENLLSAAFGLPELTAHPVAVIDARQAREQQAQLVPRLRSVAQRNSRVPLRQLVRGGAIGLAAGVVAAAVYLLSLHPTALPVAWQGYVPRWEQARPAAAPQQAALVRPSFEQAVVRPAPAPTPTQSVDPVEALLAKPTKPLPMKSRVRVGAATITTADAGNTARPVPAAMRTAAPVAPTAQPVAHAVPTAATRPAAPVPTHPAVAVKPVAKPLVAAAKPAAVAAKPLAPAAKPVVVAAKPTVAAPPKPVAAQPPTAAKPVMAKAPVAAAAAAEATTIKARTGRFYIMVAAYSSLARAEEGRRNLAHAGRPAKVILPYPGTRFYRLTAADYADRPTALAAAARLRQNPHLDKGLSVFPY